MSFSACAPAKINEIAIQIKLFSHDRADDGKPLEPACDAAGNAVHGCMKFLTLLQETSATVRGHLNQCVVNFPSHCEYAVAERCMKPDTFPSAQLWLIPSRPQLHARIGCERQAKSHFWRQRGKADVVSPVDGIERNVFHGLASKLLKIKMASGAFDLKADFHDE
ncbi:MAG TPA: hypothetical protein VJ654_00630 [Noviherbaspirillum sp.]|nr:hypothetical protein [Noviherbaspirillum sp.]